MSGNTARSYSRAIPLNPLTSPDRRLLRLLAEGLTPAQAAASLGLDSTGVRAMLAGMQGRCGVAGPRRLLVRALVYGWLAG